MTLRSCDLVGEANHASVDLALADIFPLLLEKGMASPAEEVRGIRWAVEGSKGQVEMCGGCSRMWRRSSMLCGGLIEGGQRV